MKLNTAIIATLCVCFQLFAANSSDYVFAEPVNLKGPGAAQKRSFEVIPGENYAVSAKVSSSLPRTALIEVRLFSNGKQCKYIRTVRSSEKESILESVFNVGNANKAELSLRLIDDAMQGSCAQFQEVRFVACKNEVINPWDRNPAAQCSREIKNNGKVVILYPRKKATGYVNSSLASFPRNARMRFSAKVEAPKPEMAFIAVNCGAKNAPSRHVRSAWNSETNGLLTAEFDTGNAEWVSLVLRCRGTKKVNGPVKFSELKVELIPPEKTDKK